VWCYCCIELGGSRGSEDIAERDCGHAVPDIYVSGHIIDFEPHGRLRDDDPPLPTNYVGYAKNRGLSFVPFCFHILARYCILDY